jgi:hypothetical protein
MSGGYDDSEPGRNAQLALAAGLLGGKGSFGSILGNSMLGAQDTYRSSKKDQQAAELNAAHLSEIKLRAEAEQRRIAAEQRALAAQEAFRGSLTSPQMQASQAALSGGGGPTIANAAQIPKTDPTQDLMYKAMQGGLMSPLDYVKMTQKDTAPIKLGAGDKLLSPGTFKELANNPKDAGSADHNAFLLLMKTANIDPNSPQGQTLLAAKLKKDSEHGALVNMQVGLQTPTMVTRADGSQVMVQPANKPGAAAQIMTDPATGKPFGPPVKEPPAGLKEKIAQNNVELGKIDKAIEAVTAYPNAVGLKNVLPDTMMQRIDPGGVDARARIAAIGAVKIHDMAGAAQSVKEVARLAPYVPSATDEPAVVKQKLKLFRDEYAAMQRELSGGKSLAEAGAPAMSSTRAAADAILGR